MRYAFAVAGLAVAAQAGSTVTVTATEEVTVTSCAQTYTNCPYVNNNEWENWEASAKPTTTATWGTWDPSKPSPTTTATWGAWDPSKPSPTTKPWGDDEEWGTWDPSKPMTTSSAWGEWESGKPMTTSSAWGEWESGKASTTSKKPSDDENWGTWSGASTKTKPADASNTWGTWAGASTAKPVSCPAYTATAPPAWFSQLPSSVLSSLAAQWTGAPPADWCYYSYSTPAMATKTPVASSAGWDNWASATASGPVAKYTGAANVNAAPFVLGGAAAIAAMLL